MDTIKLNSKAEINKVYNIVIQDVIKNIKGVFKDENVSQSVVRDLETLWTTKFLKTRQTTVPVTLVPMKIMVPFRQTPSSQNIEIREIELMVPNHEAELLNFSTIFTKGIINAVVHLSNRTATAFLQQRINSFLVSKDQVENVVKAPEAMEQDPLDNYVIVRTKPLDGEASAKPATIDEAENENLLHDAVIEDPLSVEIEDPLSVEIEDPLSVEIEDPLSVEIEDPLSVEIEEPPEDASVAITEEIPQLDGVNDSSDDDSSDGSKTSSSERSLEIDQDSHVSDGESLNSDDDVTDEDIDTLFDSDNVILCQYMKVLRCKNKWRFYFKDGVMNLDGCDYAFHKIFGDATW